MSVKPIEQSSGVPRARVICDDCGREEVVTCDYNRRAGGNWSPNDAQARKKVIAHGWAEVKGKLRCPSCEANRKVVNMADRKPAEESAPPEPTPKERREIIKLLEDVIDDEAKRYVSGESDETVADALGVRPGWVAQLREEFFDASGDSNDMEEVLERARAMLDEEAEQKKIIAAYSIEQRKREEALRKLIADVEAIKETQGKRVCRKAGVK